MVTQDYYFTCIGQEVVRRQQLHGHDLGFVVVAGDEKCARPVLRSLLSKEIQWDLTAE